MLKNLIVSAKADYEYLLQRNKSTNIEEDFSRKLNEFIKIAKRNFEMVDSENRQRRRYARDTSKTENHKEGKNIFFFIFN